MGVVLGSRAEHGCAHVLFFGGSVCPGVGFLEGLCSTAGGMVRRRLVGSCLSLRPSPQSWVLLTSSGMTVCTEYEVVSPPWFYDNCWCSALPLRLPTGAGVRLA